MTSDVSFALQRDLDQLTDTLTDAFKADPMMAWIYPDATTRAELLRPFMRLALDVCFPHGHVYSVGNNSGAALWAPPDVDLFDDVAITKMFNLLGEQLGERAAEVGGGLMQITAEHPHDDPHFYLFVLGTASAQQSKGLGSALMTDLLERCDRQGLGAYLESSNIRNVPFYERHGFKVLSEVKVSDDFIARPMWRDPH